jgi:hypothetical protein
MRHTCSDRMSSPIIISDQAGLLRKDPSSPSALSERIKAEMRLRHIQAAVRSHFQGAGHALLQLRPRSPAAPSKRGQLSHTHLWSVTPAESGDDPHHTHTSWPRPFCCGVGSTMKEVVARSSLAMSRFRLLHTTRHTSCWSDHTNPVKQRRQAWMPPVLSPRRVRLTSSPRFHPNTLFASSPAPRSRRRRPQPGAC